MCPSVAHFTITLVQKEIKKYNLLFEKVIYIKEQIPAVHYRYNRGASMD